MFGDYPIDEKTHPVILAQYEHDQFRKMENKKFTPGHEHEWTYRLSRPPEDVLILCNDHIDYTNLAPGRYCAECHRVEFLPREEVEKQTDVRWTQLDFIELGFR
jgi:hypothetical protein